MAERDQRQRELGLIHAGAKALGLDDDAYRAMLDAVAGVESARDLDAAGRQRVIEHLRGCGYQPRPGRRATMPAKDRKPMATKVRAMLADAGRSDAYADAMAKRMFKVDRWEWLPFDRLRGLVAALEYDRRRRTAKG